jgi:allophanate hydrolase subunit 2
MDKGNRGGARIGAGRKSKADEASLVDKLSPMDETALNLLTNLLINGDFNALKLFMEYRYGKPKMTIESESNVNITGINLKDLIEFK